METIGYLVLDYHSKPKQLDQLVGYIAMVHKDMGLHRQDIFNFGTYLIQYLSKAFPLSMNDACLDVFTKYFNSILLEMALKMEEFLKDERLNAFNDEEDKENIENSHPGENIKEANTIFSAAMATTSKKTDIPDNRQEGNEKENIGKSRKRGRTLLTFCGRWSTCRNNLVYGQSLHYWKDRKKEWDNRLKQWKTLNAPNHTDPKIQISSTDDEENSAYKSKTEDENTSEVAEARISLQETSQFTVADIQNTHVVKDEFEELLIQQKIEPKESVNVSYIIDDKLVRGTDIIRLSSVPEDSNETFKESLTPRERRRARGYLRNSIQHRNIFPSVEFHNIKTKIPVESQKQGDLQEDEKVLNLQSTAQNLVKSARQRRRESRESSLH